MMFSKYKYLIVNLFFPPFLEWEFLSDCAFPDHSLLVPFFQRCVFVAILFAYVPQRVHQLKWVHVDKGCSSLINENDLGSS